MTMAVIKHVAAIRDAYPTLEQVAKWLHSVLPVLLSMLHMQC